MKSFQFIGVAVVAMLLCVGTANAFSTDDKTLNTSSGAPRFSDPDEQTPLQVFTNGNASANYGQQDSSGNSQNSGTSAPTAATFAPSGTYGAPRH